MNKKLSLTLRPLTRDRQLLFLLITNVVVAALVIALIGLSIEPNDTQVITRFSSFGTTGFYWGFWWTLWTFALLELIMVVGGIIISIRLIKLERGGLVSALLWLTIIMSFILFMIAHSIIRIAALG